MAQPSNPVRSMMLFFVGDILGRRVTPADFGGRHMKAASTLLKKMKYDYEAVEGALYSLRDREYTHFGYDSERDLPRNIQGMEILYSYGEPPLIERWLTAPPIPDVYSHDYDKWVRQWGARALRRGEWDGIYIRQDPRFVREWLEPIIGTPKFEESISKWQTQNRTSRRRKQ